ncbi:3-hydroxyacyl-CoA dehydrogenase [Rhizobium sp. Leaf391]|uniref:3-hydroxyacyl-CoA dehydrogenase n=1 Tax=Rhizobium sp. Leaf391 TaxID=1736360 RepID=UPI000713449B|nr:3-hydroxyacyl-CoA dehydrogenase [Rhizobium sp. Leaf391]KQT04536.1 3-hydroxyacyl-CoA dehydrogenase [Rhizobium sp. Leaf391]
MTEKVAIVGAGLVGSGWAIVFARAGYQVSVFDPSPEVSERVNDWISWELTEHRELGLVDNADQVIDRISIAASLEEALKGAVYVQESVFETIPVKSEVAKAIDALLKPGMIVGSSSSGIPASKFTETCKNRRQFLVAHPVNPPHLIPVVELVPAPWTDPALLAECRVLMEKIGQVPVTVNREIDGFILNRLQGALLNEAWALYSEGYASVQDIDATVSHGLGLRWSFMGPFETIDLNAPGGITDYARRLSPLYHEIALSRSQPELWSQEAIGKAEQERRQVLSADALADRRSWRDDKLAKLSMFKRENLLT